MFLVIYGKIPEQIDPGPCILTLSLLYTNMLTGVYLVVGGGLSLFFLVYVAYSIAEHKPRAVLLSILFFLLITVLWFGSLHFLKISDLIMGIMLGVFGVVTLLFFLPIGAQKKMNIDRITERVDERDIMFAREEYQPGTKQYQNYYAMRPEYQKIDDNIRKLPPLLAPGGKYYHPDASKRIGAIFDTIGTMTTRVDGNVAPDPADLNPISATDLIKHLARDLGVAEVGVAELNPMYVYSHVGRGPEPWGDPIKNHHKYVIVYTLEMRYDKVEQAPAMPTVEESAVQYLNAASISITLASYIRALGYPARAHISDSNYQIMLPPVAQDAGLGELGRIGYLISPKYGARIRLGAVTTDLPLIPDRPITFGVQDFCEKCRKCANHCPSAAIPKGGKTTVRGVEKWLMNVEHCIRYWRVLGTDCGICMKVCPFSHPPTLIHNMIRAGIKRSAFARTLSAWGDDIFYGK